MKSAELQLTIMMDNTLVLILLSPSSQFPVISPQTSFLQLQLLKTVPTLSVSICRPFSVFFLFVPSTNINWCFSSQWVIPARNLKDCLTVAIKLLVSRRAALKPMLWKYWTFKMLLDNDDQSERYHHMKVREQILLYSIISDIPLLSEAFFPAGKYPCWRVP